MPLAKLRPDFVPLPAATPLPQLTANVDGAAAVPSPARALQQQLEQRAEEAMGRDLARWSPRRTLAFVVTTSAALWMALLMAGAQVAHAVA